MDLLSIFHVKHKDNNEEVESNFCMDSIGRVDKKVTSDGRTLVEIYLPYGTPIILEGDEATTFMEKYNKCTKKE